ncbi:MAG: LytR/AlgR family response regulator transcription factor [Oscillospiraceae bacterium]
MKIFICDDEPKILSDISSKVKSSLPEAAVSEFTNGNTLLEAITEDSCDILLLDIDMPKISGLDIAARLTALANKPLLVFVTSHDELVYDSLQFHPFGFVRKGYMDKELPRILADCVTELNSREKHFCFHTANADIKLQLDEILYFESDGNYLKLFSKDKEYRFRDTLSAVENTLSDSGFIRIHKGFLVNQAAVKMLTSDEAELVNGTRIPIGRSYSETAKNSL